MSAAKFEFEIWARPIEALECKPHLEGRRSGMKAAFALARKRWREYKGTAKIEVRWDGTLIADNPSDFYL